MTGLWRLLKNGMRGRGEERKRKGGRGRGRGEERRGGGEESRGGQEGRGGEGRSSENFTDLWRPLFKTLSGVSEVSGAD